VSAHSSKPAAAAAIAAILLGVAVPGRAQPSSPAAVSPKTGLSIGVAPFERVGDVGAEVPDVALMLARRLSTLGVGRVASPSDIGGTPMADPEARTAVEQAARGGVGALVVGRATGIGGKLSIDARLRDGRTGEPIGRRFFVEVAKPRDLAAGIEQLATQVVAQANEAVAPGETAEVAAPPRPEAAAAPAGAPEARAAGKEASAGFDSEAPITIKSDTLDVFEQGGQRRFVFVGNVRANQADLAIRSEKLEAFYPEGGSQPERIVASGAVSLTQAGRTARCTQATFYRRDDRIVCVGDVAEVVQGCDIVRGREIVFHTASQLLKVNGAADVRINPEAEGCKGATPGTGQ
jgi:lipopolysaccharide transport protein LptA